MKLELDLTPGEMLALGYCMGSGSREAESRGETHVSKDIEALMVKIYKANEKEALKS